MRLLITVSLSALIACPMLAQQPPIGRFPSADGERLSGEHVRVPDVFAGTHNLVFVAFTRGQQSDVDTWTPLAKRLAAGDTGFRSYELPTLARRYRLIRPMIDGGMRRGIPDSATRSSTITLYIDKSPFERALGIANEDSIAVVLVGHDGHVLWMTRGPHTAEAEAALLAELKSIAP